MTLTEFVNEPSLKHNDRQGRLGVVYLRALAAQAGCAFYETSSGEDLNAIDALIEVGDGEVYVQIKSTRSFTMGATGSAISYSVLPHWLARWTIKSKSSPIYFVVVTVPPSNQHWMHHHTAGTDMQDIAAYWTRVQVAGLTTKSRIQVPRVNRLEAATFQRWQDEKQAMYK